MAELERAGRADWPQELEGGVGSLDPRWKEATNQALALADTARRLPEMVSSLSLVEVDRRSFNAQAATLFDQAARLETAARGGDIPTMQRALAEVDSTCQSCHTRFRDISGPLADR